ncbi:MAG TPA: hypothetical protein VIF57_11155 [Polyangia bacterium]
MGVSVVPLHVWRLMPALPMPVFGVYLLHVASGVQLNVRTLPAQAALSADAFAAASMRYLDGGWPGPRRITTFAIDGGLRGAVGVYDDAMPGAIVREWLITDGTRLLNAAAYATARQWEDRLLDDAEALLRSLRFE